MSNNVSEEVTVEAPAPLTLSEEEMPSERPARLLEAGEYPDKGLTLTESDLDAIAARFTAGVPVKVEHTDSPLDPLGRVQRVWREGNALLGILAFPSDLAGFLRRRGAAKLSVGLSREPLALLEVSLVLKPRVASAAFLGESNLAESSLNAEIVRLRAALSGREADAQVAAFKAQGRIVPASEAAARALLGSDSGERAAVGRAGAGVGGVSALFGSTAAGGAAGRNSLGGHKRRFHTLRTYVPIKTTWSRPGQSGGARKRRAEREIPCTLTCSF